MRWLINAAYGGYALKEGEINFNYHCLKLNKIRNINYKPIVKIDDFNCLICIAFEFSADLFLLNIWRGGRIKTC